MARSGPIRLIVVLEKCDWEDGLVGVLKQAALKNLELREALRDEFTLLVVGPFSEVPQVVNRAQLLVLHEEVH